MIRKFFAVIMIPFVATTVLLATESVATPSSQVWIPSPDAQTVGTLHFGVDNFTTISRKVDNGGRQSPTVFGLTVGVFEDDLIGVELGIDIKEQSDYPTYFNAKIVVKEDSFTLNSPAVAFGIYDFGTDNDNNNYKIVYVLAAKSIPYLGRLSLGYYVGNSSLVVDKNGNEENDGWLASFDRTLAEIDDRLWMAIDYMGGDNAYGATSFGLAWRFSPQVSTLFGYGIYNDNDVAGEDTFTIQLDIDF